MFKKLIHKLKMRFGKKTKITPEIIYGVTHATDEALNSCWGAVTLPEQRFSKQAIGRHTNEQTKT